MVERMGRMVGGGGGGDIRLLWIGCGWGRWRVAMLIKDVED